MFVRKSTIISLVFVGSMAHDSRVTVDPISYLSWETNIYSLPSQGTFNLMMFLNFSRLGWDT